MPDLPALELLMGGWSYEVELTGVHMKSILRQARKQKAVFQVTIDQLWRQFCKQGGQCELSALKLEFGSSDEITTAYLDRIDPTRGYVEGNVRWLHNEMAQLKAGKSDHEFFQWIRYLAWVRRSAGYPPAPQRRAA